MKAATHLAHGIGLLSATDRDRILRLVEAYGPVPSLDGITPDTLASRLVTDKKTIQGKVHFVLPDRIGHVVVRSGIDERQVLDAIRAALA
jgi:3-dehydroquinate synthase